MKSLHRDRVLVAACYLAFTVSEFQAPGGNSSSPQRQTAVLKIEEGYVDAQGVYIYYKSFGSGPPLVILHGGPGASHDYLLPHLVPLAQKNRLVLIRRTRGGQVPEAGKSPLNATLKIWWRTPKRSERRSGSGRSICLAIPAAAFWRKPMPSSIRSISTTWCFAARFTARKE